MENADVHVVGGQVADPVAEFVFGLGLMTLGVAIHCVKSKVASGGIQRNSAIGVRTKATMSSDSAWQAGHAAAAPMLTATFLTAYTMGVISSALGLTSTLIDAENSPAMVIPLGGLVVVLALLVISAIKANSAARAVGRSRM